MQRPARSGKGRGSGSDLEGVVQAAVARRRRRRRCRSTSSVVAVASSYAVPTCLLLYTVSCVLCALAVFVRACKGGQTDVECRGQTIGKALLDRHLEGRTDRQICRQFATSVGS